MRLIRFAAAMACVVLLAGCGSSSSSSPTNPTPTPTPNPPASGGAPAAAVTITIPRGATSLTTTAYTPNPATVAVGGTVTWVNNDVDTHDTAANNRLWASPNIGPGGRFTFTFPTAGTFSYFCTIHPNMIGTIVVQ
jgi:plastocyanin